MTYGEIIPNVNTLGYWRLNGDGLDSGQYGNDGMVSDDTTANFPGRFGTCVEFNPTNFSKVTINQHSTLRPTGDHTVSLWVKPTSYDETWDVHVFHVGTYVDWHVYGIMIGFPEGINSGVYYARGVDQYVFGGAITSGVWTNIVCTFDGSIMTIYINGCFSADTSSSEDTIYFGDDPLIIGARYTTSGDYIPYNFWEGKIDEVIFEGVAWSPQYVRKYYTQCMARFYNNVSY
jgi:hypothetical protein